MSEALADVLANGREYIEKNGWWKDRLVGPNGRQACLVGGLALSLGYPKWQAEAGEDDLRVVMACEALANLIDIERAYPTQGHVTFVEHWNDHVAEGKQEVLDLMAKAEKIARAGFDPDA